MTNLNSILKSRDITLLTKVRVVKAMVFPVDMRMSDLDHKEDWGLKNRCFQFFKLWFWRRLLRVPWTARRSNQSILWEINLEYSLEGLILKLKLQYFGHLMKSQPFGKDPDAKKDWEEKKTASMTEMAGWYHWCNGHDLGQSLGDDERYGGLAFCSPWNHKYIYLCLYIYVYIFWHLKKSFWQRRNCLSIG